MSIVLVRYLYLDHVPLWLLRVNQNKSASLFFGLACGAFVGFAIGVLIAVGLGYWALANNPDDPSAGSIAIMVIFTAPGGMGLGAVLGGLTITRWPSLFRKTFVPLGGFFACLLLIYFVVEAINQS